MLTPFSFGDEEYTMAEFRIPIKAPEFLIEASENIEQDKRVVAIAAQVCVGYLEAAMPKIIEMIWTELDGHERLIEGAYKVRSGKTLEASISLPPHVSDEE
jgi:hypothetical protein